MNANRHMTWQKRVGLQIASQLPDSVDDALLVLDYAREVYAQLAKYKPVPAATV